MKTPKYPGNNREREKEWEREREREHMSRQVCLGMERKYKRTLKIQITDPFPVQRKNDLVAGNSHYCS